MSLTSLQQVVVMEFGKRPDTTDTTDCCPALTCFGLSKGKLVLCSLMDFGLN